MDCFVCKTKNDTNADLFKHLKFYHPFVTSYTCSENDCRRSFSSLRTFKTHRLQKHLVESIPSSSNNTPFEQSLSSSTVECSIMPSASISSDSDTLLEPSSSSFTFENLNDSTPLINCDIDVTYEPGYSIDFIEKFDNLLQNDVSTVQNSSVTQCVAYLYALADLPRKRVPEILDVFSKFLACSPVKNLHYSLLLRLKELGETSDNLKKYDALYDSCYNPFSNINSEYLAFKNFVNSGNLILPQSIKIGDGEEYKCDSTGINKLVHVPYFVEFIPMNRVLKRFFEIPDVLKQTISYMKKLNVDHDVISNFIQGDFWKNLKLNGNYENSSTYLTLPLVLFFDDYENNNPLGSHAGVAKCGAVYCSIPCLPIEYQSKLENIFLFILFNSLDRTNFGNKLIFSKLIEEIKFLENTGIDVHTNLMKTRLFFKLVLITGDNLGQNSILGFVESFSATYPCRFCMVKKNDFNNIFNEKDCEMRTPQTYAACVEKNNVSETGIKEECVFHSILGFHVTSNIVVDSMHDMLEGVCKYDLGNILYHYIYEKKIFSIEQLNDRIRGFNYDANEKRNKPPLITASHLQRRIISMSSSEMLCFVRNFTLMIGDLIPDGDVYWSLVIKLKIILEIVYAKRFHKSMYQFLDTLITEYLTSLQTLFPHCFKPKHHFLLHYPNVMKLMGPLSNISSMRYESKHREGKRTSSVSLSRVNVCHTIAIKHQLILNHRFTLNKIEYPVFTHSTLKLLILQDVEKYDSFSNFVPLNPDTMIYVTRSIKFNGLDIFVESTILMLASSKGPKFFKTFLIALEKSQELFIIAKLVETVYDLHYDAYLIISKENCSNKWKFISLKDLSNYIVTFSVRLSNSNYYIAKKWA